MKSKISSGLWSISMFLLRFMILFAYHEYCKLVRQNSESVCLSINAPVCLSVHKITKCVFLWNALYTLQMLWWWMLWAILRNVVTGHLRIILVDYLKINYFYVFIINIIWCREEYAIGHSPKFPIIVVEYTSTVVMWYCKVKDHLWVKFLGSTPKMCTFSTNQGP